jgi:uncharacterized protein (DUF2461 family)
MDTLPTFSGFPQAGLEVLANLAAHNNREWFEAQKNDYRVLLLEPAQAFVLILGAKLQMVSNGYCQLGNVAEHCARIAL